MTRRTTVASVNRARCHHRVVATQAKPTSGHLVGGRYGRAYSVFPNPIEKDGRGVLEKRRTYSYSLAIANEMEDGVTAEFPNYMG